MTMLSAKVLITGTNPLLMNNPQMADPTNDFKKRVAVITKKGVRRTDEDYIHQGNLEVEAKLYFDKELGVVIPYRWLLSAICGCSNAVAKISQAKIRSAVFIDQKEVSLQYANMDKVTCPQDIIGNPEFRLKLILPQGKGVRIPKSMPQFKDWSFEFTLIYDDAVMDFSNLARIIEWASKYGGFGDFRPTFGRALATVTEGGI